MKKTILTTTLLTTSLGLLGAIPISLIQNATINTDSSIRTELKDQSLVNQYYGRARIQRSTYTCAKASSTITIFEQQEIDVSNNIKNIIHNDDNKLLKEFIRQLFNFEDMSYVTGMKYDTNTNVLSFMCNGEFISLCSYDRGNSNPEQHSHSEGYFTLARKNGGNKQSNINVSIQLNQPINLVGTDYTNIFGAPTSFVRMDQDKTFQGFRYDYVTLKIDSAYLLGVAICSANTDVISNIKKDPRYTTILHTADFNTVLQQLEIGALFDKEYYLSEKIIPDAKYNNPLSNVRYWLNKILANEDISKIHSRENWLDNWIDISNYKLMQKYDYTSFAYDEFLLNYKNLSVDIHWNNHDRSEVLTVDFNYDMNKKLFMPKNMGDENGNILIKLDRKMQSVTSMTISKIELIDKAYKNKQIICNVEMIGLYGRVSNLSKTPVVNQFYFDIRRLIRMRENLTVDYWKSRFKLHMSDPETWINNPESVIDNPLFKQIVTDFSTPDSPMMIVDEELDAYLRTDKNLSFSSNALMKNIIKNMEFWGFNSVNGVKIFINMFDYDSLGDMNSNSSQQTHFRFSLSPTTNESINTRTAHKIVYAETLPLRLEMDYFIDNFIGFNNETDNKVMTTTLSRRDWRYNVFAALYYNEFPDYGNDLATMNVTLRYYETTSSDMFVNSTNISEYKYFDFVITTNKNDLQPLPESPEEPKDNNEGTQQNLNVSSDNSAMALWISLPVVATAFVIFVIAGYYFSRSKKKNINHRNNSNDDSEELLAKQKANDCVRQEEDDTSETPSSTNASNSESEKSHENDPNENDDEDDSGNEEEEDIDNESDDEYLDEDDD